MKVKLGAWISGAVAFVGVLVGGIICTVKFDSIIPLLLALLVEAIIFISCIFVTLREKKEKFCANCKQQYKFDDDIEYEEIERYTKSYRYDPSKDRKQKVESLTYKIGFDCTCPKCGAKKSYTKKLYGGAEYSDGSIDLKDPEQIISSYFKYQGLSVNDTKTIIAGFGVGVVSIFLGIVLACMNFSWMGDLFGPSPKSLLDADNYYGTYYGLSSNYTEYKLTISDRRVELRTDDLLTGGSIQQFDDGEQVFYTAEYMTENHPNEKFEDCGALILDERYVFWIVEDYGSDSTFAVVLESGETVILTTEEITLEIATGDPKDYYGKYELDAANSVYIQQGGKCNVYISGMDTNYSSWYYFYADQGVLNVLGVMGYSEGIVVYSNSQFVTFVFIGEDLALIDSTTGTQYLFKKQASK